MSAQESIYLDWAATSLPDKQVLEECLALSCLSYGNPSSAHGKGKEAGALLEEARMTLAQVLENQGSAESSGQGAKARGKIAFTGSGTEADQIPLLSVLKTALGKPAGLKDCHIVVSAIEHPAVFAQAKLLEQLGIGLSVVKPEANGRVSAEKIQKAIRPQTRLVAVMAVNNETGAVQDIEAIGRTVREAQRNRGSKEILFHVDFVQALGKLRISLDAALMGSAAFSAHKIGGPRGVGALWISKNMEVLGAGGGQEGGLRSGTQNIFGALAFARCARKAALNLDERLERARMLESALIDGIGQIPGARVLPECRKPGDPRYSPWILSAAFPGLSGEVLARALSDQGIAVSTGSACSQLDRKKGHRILDAMDTAQELSFSSIRISTGATTGPKDIERLLSTCADLYRRLKT
ncbi:MAG: cysteine desulfurase family protein [Spirochaetia bacterium]|nr:cysteine desulfurase family protein [Spirochaetia bacterium]